MADERRASRRAPLAGVRVTYESSSGERVEADVGDLAAGGLFIRTQAPMPVGKRIALDLHVLGESGPWSALGRVVWTRAEGDAAGAPGMGVKLIDVDDATVQAIERLVDTREPTVAGVGGVPAVTVSPVVVAVPGAVTVERERTLLGVGSETASSEPSAAPRPAAGAPAIPTTATAELSGSIGVPPIDLVAAREQSVAIDLVPAAAREQSVAIDLLPSKVIAPAPEAAPEPAPAPPPPPTEAASHEPAPEREAARVPVTTRSATPSVAPDAGGGAGRWVVLLLLVIVAGVAAYVLFDGFLRPIGP